MSVIDDLYESADRRPDHTFLLDARQDATAGVQREDEEA